MGWREGASQPAQMRQDEIRFLSNRPLPVQQNLFALQHRRHGWLKLVLAVEHLRNLRPGLSPDEGVSILIVGELAEELFRRLLVFQAPQKSRLE